MSADYRHRDTHRSRTRGALRLVLAVGVAAWALGCDDSQSPMAVGEIPKLTVEVGTTESVDLAGYFSDPDGDELSYEVSSSNSEVATVAISGGSVAVKGVATGSAGITVKASDGSSSASQDFTASVVPLADRGVLLIMYDELGGDDWTDNTNWKTDKPLGEWYGVGTDADGRVDSLDLERNAPRGEIPPELGRLSNLRYLSLRGRLLTGAIPPELGNLSNLQFLYLNHTSLTGAIPPELGDLSNLEVLNLRENTFTGEIPPELGNLSSLEVLNFFVNSLTGEIPPELGNLSNLEVLYLAVNSLTGEVPPELGDLSNLEVLYVDVNSLTGEVPRGFLDLSLLRRFFWDDNDGLCAPNTVEFDNWLDGIDSWRGPRCD